MADNISSPGLWRMQLTNPLPDRVLGPRRIAVVPVRNEEATIAATLDKLGQVVDELVVVDDGSSDGTCDEVRAWLDGQGQHPLAAIASLRPSGPPRARSSGPSSSRTSGSRTSGSRSASFRPPRHGGGAGGARSSAAGGPLASARHDVSGSDGPGRPPAPGVAMSDDPPETGWPLTPAGPGGSTTDGRSVGPPGAAAPGDPSEALRSLTSGGWDDLSDVSRPPTADGSLDAPDLRGLLDVGRSLESGAAARAEASSPGDLPEPRAHRGRLLTLDEPQGVAAAYRLGFADLRRRLDEGALSPDDLVVTLDAAGRHDLDILDDLQRLAVKERLDALLLRREPPGGSGALGALGSGSLGSLGSLGWRLGNGLVSAWASLWAGERLHDVATGYRIFRLAPLTDALDHQRSSGPLSASIELAVAVCRLGGRVRNDVLVAVPLPRSGPALSGGGLSPVVAGVAAAPVTAYRVEQGRSARGVGVDTAAPDDPPRVLARLATPLAATAALAGALLWLTWRSARAVGSLLRLLPRSRRD